MLKKELLLGLLLLTSNAALANDLMLQIYPDYFGMQHLYIKNIGQKDTNIITDNLAFARADEYLTVSNRTASVSLDGKVGGEKKMLKQSVILVTLRPGEMAHLPGGQIKESDKKVFYLVSEEWGKLHDAWYGEIELSLE